MKESKLNRERLLMRIDRKICGGHQVPAVLYHRLSDDGKTAEKLARGRVVMAGAKGIESAGMVLGTYGLSENSLPLFFALGTAMKICGRMIAAHTQNENGAYWDLLLSEKIGKLGLFRPAVHAALVDKGFTTEEIEKLKSLPVEVYKTELQIANETRMQNGIVPIGSGLTMIGYGDILTGGAVTLLGLCTFPVGDFFYRESDQVRAAEFRVGRSAKHTVYQRGIQNDHIGMTDKINLMSMTPEAIFALKYWLAAGGNFLAGFNGLVNGLSGFTQAFALQRERESSRRTTEMATHFIQALTSEPFIATKRRWQEHVSIYQDDPLDIKIQEGIVIRDFKARLPNGGQSGLLPINLTLEKGCSAIFRADSGTGKSSTFMAMLHLLDHEGSIHFVKNGTVNNIHRLKDPEEVAENILFVTKEAVDPTDRIADLFKNSFLYKHQDLYKKHLEKNPKKYVDLAWQTADNLLEQEIKKMRKGKRSVFPKDMLPVIIEIFEGRIKWVNSLLKEAKGNLAKKDMNSERIFSSLSAGQKERLLVTVAVKTVESGKIKAVILDEPVGHLGEANRRLQIKELKAIQEKAPLLITTHEHVDQLQTELGNCQILDLDNPNQKQEEDKEETEVECNHVL
ncbi:MAG: hypothetical protein UT63_C0025G0007 [Candidatus Gottesmanbacteria bacterium GW2011_GWC2_39_8]|uniref:ABC transporter domain-containing protein n=1 Tax=Candidatus Gottesmanbacteria bacterium GW2011_GWC2_39_8 TaxID=1618450 RepID=A0A0G0SE87_9BACT|nr:MAG: hypothetical protein UT63_C0025G0007 [Candidatus Gottesmanbacteria bacterium GW2011_GWC2_39_8]